MANVKVRATALHVLESGRPLAPGDVLSLPEGQATELIDAGKAVAVPKPTPKKKETSNEPAGS